MNKKFWLLLTFPLLLACSRKKEEKVPPVLSLQAMGKLATAEYIITKIVRASDTATWYKIGDRRILISCKASVKAGIDLSAIGPEDIVEEEGKITVKIPRASVLTLNMAPEDIKVEYQEVGFFRDPFSSAEQNWIMKQAQKQIEQQIAYLDILQTAEANAVRFLHTFFTQAGYTDVTIQPPLN